jgi:integrase
VFATRYLAEHAEAHKRASSVAEDRRLLARVIIPRLGRHRLDRIARADVSALHHARRGTPVDANRALALLSKMLNVAEALGLREPGSNPCRGIPRYRELKRERFLSDAEMARLGAVLAEAEREGRESPFVLAAVRLLLFTGARLGEVLNARWADVDLAAGLLRILRPKEGRSKALRLGPPALEVLAKLPRIEGNPYVIVGRKDGGRFVGIQHVWQRVRLRAGLADVRLHDLRHSFASVAAAGGASLPIIGALLGHTQAATTQRYAHLSDDPLRAVAENVSMRIAAALRSDPEDKQDDANVLSLKRA